MLRRQIKGVERAALLKGNRGGAKGGKIDIEIAEMRHLMRALRVEIVGPDIGAEVRVTIGEKIDRMPEPHRRGVGSFPVGDLRQPLGVEVIGVDIRRAPTDITLAKLVVDEDAIVGNRFAIGRIGKQARTVQWKRCFQASGERHAVSADQS